jgi:hypothetical protein
MLNGPIEIDSVPVDDRGANEAQALDVVEPIRLYWVMGRSGFGYFTPPILALDAMGGLSSPQFSVPGNCVAYYAGFTEAWFTVRLFASFSIQGPESK